MMLAEQTFKKALPGKMYRNRVGCYAVAFDARGRTAVVRVSGKDKGYFLVGGGLESGESHRECLQRECLEETGRSLALGVALCLGDEYLWSEKCAGYVHVFGYCYRAALGAVIQPPVETDHTLLWLTPEECIPKMLLEYQAWAISQALKQGEKT